MSLRYFYLISPKVWIVVKIKGYQNFVRWQWHKRIEKFISAEFRGFSGSFNLSHSTSFGSRLKLKHETKLQKEYFEKKRQLKSNTNIAISQRVSKATARASQDLLSLEVIMAAHREKKKQKKDKRSHTSETIGHTTFKKSSQAPYFRESSLKQPQHIFPELSPIRPKVSAVNLEKSGQGIHLHSDLENQEGIFSRRSLSTLCTDGCESKSDRQIITDHEGKFCLKENAFPLDQTHQTF